LLHGGEDGHKGALGWIHVGREEVTIVAGFPGTDWVLLCADSEETGSLTKGSVRKIAPIQNDASTCLIGGSGNGDFIDLAVQQSEEALRGQTTLKAARLAIEGVVTQIYSQRIDSLPPRDQTDAAFQLLCAVCVPDEGVQLIKVQRAISLVMSAPVSLGIGNYLASYLINTFGFRGMDLRRVQRLAVYLLAQVKAHVAFCGGSSQVVWLGKDRSINELPPIAIQWDETSMRIAMIGAGQLIHFADPTVNWWEMNKLDAAVDETAANVKTLLHREFDAVADYFKRAAVATAAGSSSTSVVGEAPKAEPSATGGNAHTVDSSASQKQHVTEGEAGSGGSSPGAAGGTTKAGSTST
jgi:hypothetical protein